MEPTKIKLYNKLHAARKYIKTCDMEKKGENTFSHYKYFTPEQISELVFLASEDQKILPMFSLMKNEHGHYGVLIIQDLESESFIQFEMSSGIPEIKATNITQQLGGAVTYTERYLLMTAFDIKDNSLDPDDTKNTEKTAKSGGSKQAPSPEQKEKPWLNKWRDTDKKMVFDSYKNLIKEAKEKGMGVAELRDHYKISKEMATELETDLKA